MLKNLLKYEFRATARTYGGIYLALLAAAGLIGFSFRGDRAAAQSHVFELGVTIYSLLVMALVIVTIVTVIQRFTSRGEGRHIPEITAPGTFPTLFPHPHRAAAMGTWDG